MTVWLLDLDGTLYTDRTGLWPAISRRITLYLQERLKLDEEAAWALRRRLAASHGTTLRGLLAEFPAVADPQDYFAFTHNLRLSDYLAPDPALRETLQALPGGRWVFTNADAPHARRVLALLGVEDLLDGVVDIFATALWPKPKPQAYRRALALVGSPSPAEAVMVDDRWENIVGAREAGFRTVWVTRQASPARARLADAVVEEIYRLPMVAAALLQGG